MPGVCGRGVHGGLPLTGCAAPGAASTTPLFGPVLRAVRADDWTGIITAARSRRHLCHGNQPLFAFHARVPARRGWRVARTVRIVLVRVLDDPVGAAVGGRAAPRRPAAAGRGGRVGSSPGVADPTGGGDHAAGRGSAGPTGVRVHEPGDGAAAAEHSGRATPGTGRRPELPGRPGGGERARPRGGEVRGLHVPHFK